jgi:hypothetical protein
MERHLTTLFGNVDSNERTLVETAASKKNGWLPVLTVLFLISYGLMTMLIVEQGQTIESQRALIRELFRDSTELSAVKMKAQEQRSQALKHGSSSQVSSNQARSNAPSTQAPTVQIPSTQAGAPTRTQNPAAKKQFRMPSRPASDLADSNRSLMTI